MANNTIKVSSSFIVKRFNLLNIRKKRKVIIVLRPIFSKNILEVEKNAKGNLRTYLCERCSQAD